MFTPERFTQVSDRLPDLLELHLMNAAKPIEHVQLRQIRERKQVPITTCDLDQARRMPLTTVRTVSVPERPI
jgi:hypothetical protein